MRNWINVAALKPDGKLDSIETFMPATSFNHPIDLEVGPDGVLYVLEYGTYWFAKNKDAGLYRIEYNRGNRAPVVALKADKLTGTIPLTVHFSSEGTYDLDSSKLFYKWYFDKNEAQSTEANATYEFKNAGIYNVRLIVADNEGKRNEKIIKITAGNAEPDIFLEVNGNKSYYWNNTPIEYKINVVDKEDGSLQSGTITPENVKVTLSYNTMGTDMTTVAQDHEATLPATPGSILLEKNDCKSCHGFSENRLAQAIPILLPGIKKTMPP